MTKQYANAPWPAYGRHIELMQALAEQKALRWEMVVDEEGTATEESAWDLRQLNQWPGRHAVRLSDFSPIQDIREALLRKGVPEPKLARGSCLSHAWQDLIKAMCVSKCVVEQRMPRSVRALVRATRALATATSHEPWELTSEDVLRALTVVDDDAAKRISNVCSYIDKNFLSACVPVSPGLDQRRKKGTPLMTNLADRPHAKKLPERDALYELVRIIWNEQPLSHFDEMRFLATRVMLLTGLRADEIVNLPYDCLRIEQLTDVNTGAPAASIGGVSEVMYLRYFAVKTRKRKSAAHLYEKRQYIPTRFQSIVKDTVDAVRRATDGLRTTLRGQIENGRRPLFRFPLDHALTAQEALDLICITCQGAGTARIALAAWAGASARELPEVITPAFIESTSARKAGVKSDFRTFVLSDGAQLDCADMLFLVPAKNSYITGAQLAAYPFVGVLSAANVGVGLGSKRAALSLFGRYGRDEFREASINPHSLRHLMNTELFRLNVSDTIITHHFGRESVAQSHEYDHRSLLERLDSVDLPDQALKLLGDGAATVVGKLVAGGFAEESAIAKTFKKLQRESGDIIAYEYLKANADGFHVTPYGFCTNSFSLNPCSRHLKCVDDCRHFVASGTSEHVVSLQSLRQSLIDARNKASEKPAKTIGRKNQIAHAERLIAGVDAALSATKLATVFPDGLDHSKPSKDVFE